MKKLILIVILISSFLDYIDCQVSIDTMRSISNEVNKLALNFNLHYHPAYAQQNKRVEKFNGKVKSELRTYNDGSTVEFKYSEDGDLLSKRIYKNDTLSKEYLYDYDDAGRLKFEKGENQIDYKVLDKNLVYGLNVADIKPVYYRTNDTMFVLDKEYRYEVRRKMDNSNEIDEEFKFKYNINKDLKSIQLYQNGVRYGQILNKFDENNLIIEHQFFHSFSSFANEREWGSNFRNSLYTFSYNSQGFWSEIVKESYNPQSRIWEKSSKIYSYEFDVLPKGYRITKKRLNSEQPVEYVIELDDQFNWINQLTLKKEGNIKTIRDIEYY